MLTAEQLARCEAVLEAATPGPWTVEREGRPGVLVCDDVGDSVCRVSGNEADAEFMVVARSAMPELVEIAKLARELTTALDGVLGTESDDPDFEAKWDLAEATCDRARELLGIRANGPDPNGKRRALEAIAACEARTKWPRLGAAQRSLLAQLARHAGPDSRDRVWDPGALNPRKTLDGLVRLGLAERATDCEFGWRLTHEGLFLHDRLKEARA